MTTATLSLESLLAEGRRVLAAQDAERRAELDAAGRARVDAWNALVAVLPATLGPLADAYGPLMADDLPDDFDPARTYQFTLRPFGAAELLAGFFAPADGAGPWRFTGTYHVPAGYYPQTDEDGGFWPCRTGATAGVQSLAEALALCERMTDSYRKCAADCERRAAALKAKAKAKAATPPAPPPPTPAERLLAALEDFVASCRPGGA